MKKDLLLNAATGLLTVCAVVITALMVRREVFPGSQAFATPTATVPDWREYAAVGRRMGPAGARVTITEFSDFECPYCRLMADRLRAIREKHPDEVAVVFRHFPLPRHQFAHKAALASDCAAAQGRFEAMHDVLFAGQDSIGQVPWTGFAVAAGVRDIPAFRRCISDPAGFPAISRDSAAARQLRVASTPTILINDERLIGALPLDTIMAHVEHALAASPPVPVRLQRGR
jgi:protein-disulfide isomerase